ncbi:unnamed protein product [Echinostoma caproni]|uniref:Morc6_S5 domain-containing protein n=1 Tax=Echinostoma caproni TaxID=27848 RepID=A0A183B566_9TREM|nr:unnamed protein product [Echinostoma caproni]
METYAQLNRAQLSFDYLHTNSTTHEFLFGAIAELIDNARDAGYRRFLCSVRGNFLLCFADNGCGMSPDEVKNVIIFGKSLKRSEESSTIGMYGNGLKSGSMRIGNDMMLFTKRDGVYTCLFLSRSFHEEEKLEEVCLLSSYMMPAGDRSSAIFQRYSGREKKEMHLILKYSPFRCLKDFFAQFDKLKDASGTVVIIYNMKLLDHGAPELDITTNPRDILLASGPETEETVNLGVIIIIIQQNSVKRTSLIAAKLVERDWTYFEGGGGRRTTMVNTVRNRTMHTYRFKHSDLIRNYKNTTVVGSLPYPSMSSITHLRVFRTPTWKARDTYST